MFESIFVCNQFLVLFFCAKKVADTTQNLKWSGFFVHLFYSAEQLLEMTAHIAYNQAINLLILFINYKCVYINQINLHFSVCVHLKR